MNYNEIIQQNIDLINELRRIDILNELEIKIDKELTEKEIESLLKIASLFSLEKDYYELSYEITTKLFKNYYEKYEGLNDFAYSILSRLGNFPNRKLLKEYGFDIPKIKNLNIISEIFTREIDNTIQINEMDIKLTDFQKDFYKILLNENKYSISAPTSAGKSFIFQLAIVEKFKQNIEQNIIFIVPTRALIIEFSKNMRKIFKKYNLNAEIRTLPIFNEDDNKSILYILTQERLNSLLEISENIVIDTLFIDEAQELQGNRGVILQNTIEKFIYRFPDSKLYFAAPLIKNPNVFNNLFNFDEQKYSIETFSPVGQNILFVSSIKRKTKKVKIKLYKNDNYIDIGIFDLDFKFRNKKRIIDFSIFITKDDEQTILFCNLPSDAEKNALLLAEKLEKIEDEEIRSLIEYIKEDIHPEYSLIECLKKGVAFHYSYMPSNVKIKIEELANKGKLKFICCTSTLLQGVNLPVKNIVVYKPKSGKYNQMKRSDFLNLIGRAGRLQKEFNGNIWCIETKEWDNRIYEGEKLQEIKPYYQEAMEKHINSLIKIAKEESLDKEEKEKSLDTVFGKFFIDMVIEHKEQFNLESIQTLKDEAEKIERLLSDEIYKKHYSIHPNALNRLYKALKEKNDILKYIPQNIYETGNNLKRIIKIIDEKILNINNLRYKFISFMIRVWIHNKLFKDIIIGYHKKYQNKEISSSIKEVLEVIETQIRFKYVLYASAYIDILKIVLDEKNIQFDDIPNLPLYLESGSGDKIVLNLISLGLSRNTSIRLKNLNIIENCDDIKSCYESLKNLNIENLDLPQVLKEEIMGIK